MKRQERTSRSGRPGQGPGYCRQAYSLPADVADGIRRIAFWDRVTLSDVVARAVRELREKLEKKLGEPYAPIPAARMGRPER